MSTRDDADVPAHRSDRTRTSAVEACVDLVRAASEGHLLADAATLDAALRGRGWTWGRRGGQWNPPPDLDAGVITLLTPPSVDVILTDPDDALLDGVAEEVVDEVEALLGAPQSRGPVPGTDQQVDAVWDRHDLSVSVVFLPSTSDQSDTAPGRAPEGFLRLGLLRPDVTAAEEDADRARHLAHHGSPAERWHLAGQAFLPDDLVALLDGDDDAAVVRAVRVGASRRDLMASREGWTRDDHPELGGASSPPRLPDGDGAQLSDGQVLSPVRPLGAPGATSPSSATRAAEGTGRGLR